MKVTTLVIKGVDRNIKEILDELNHKGYGHSHEDDYVDDKMLCIHKVLHASHRLLCMKMDSVA